MGGVDDERGTAVAAAEDGERREQEEQGSNGSHGRDRIGRGQSPGGSYPGSGPSAALALALQLGTEASQLVFEGPDLVLGGFHLLLGVP